jgi:hypothetical protein
MSDFEKAAHQAKMLTWMDHVDAMCQSDLDDLISS